MTIKYIVTPLILHYYLQLPTFNKTRQRSLSIYSAGCAGVNVGLITTDMIMTKTKSKVLVTQLFNFYYPLYIVTRGRTKLDESRSDIDHEQQSTRVE